MHSPINAKTVVIVGILGIILPVFIRVISSPLTLLVLSPFLALCIAFTCLVTNVVIGYFLDAKRAPTHRNTLPSAARPLAFTTPAAWQALSTRSQWSHKPSQPLPPLCPDLPAVSSALDDILTMVIRDFVFTWYKDLSSSPSFPAAVSSVLHDSIGRLLDRASSVDLSALIVRRIIPKVTAHIEQFRQSEVALRGAKLERSLTHSEELDLLLASRYSHKGGERLHPAIDNLSSTFTKQTEEAHLRNLIERALPFILPEPESQSKALKVVIREIVACIVVYPAMALFSDPDFWNRSIDEVVSRPAKSSHHSIRITFFNS